MAEECMLTWQVVQYKENWGVHGACGERLGDFFGEGGWWGGGGGGGSESPRDRRLDRDRQTGRQRQTDGETERQGTRQGQGKVESRMACRNVSMKAGSRNSWKEQKGAWLEKAGEKRLGQQARESRQSI